MKNKFNLSAPDFLSRIRNRLKLRSQFIIFLLIQSGIILGVSGIYVDWQVRKAVEDELGQKLLVIGHVAAEQIKNTRALQLVPGEENSRTLQGMHNRFAPVLSSQIIARILLLDSNRACYFDSDRQIPIGVEYYRARLDAQEIDSAFAGQPSTSRFFFDQNNKPFKSVYIPVEIDQQKNAAVLCLEASAGGLAAIYTMRKVLLTIGILAIIGAVLSAGIIARQVTRPLENLEKAAEAVGRGKFDTPLEQTGSSEIVFLAQTIEEMRQAIDDRQQRQQMMLAGVAHEVRNPLGGIKLFASVLQKTANEELQPHIVKITKEVNHLNEIITDFLSYAKPVQANPEMVNINQVVAEIHAVLETQNRGLRWDLQIADDLTVFIDPGHIRQILSNLLQNAVLAVRESENPIVAILGEKKRNHAQLIISDNGPGVASEVRDKIFQPFFTTRNEGTGLGLALARLLAEENNSLLALQQSESGAKFRLIVPIFEVENK
ncbi:MAG: sensor histidine kinase [Calditrichaeota bacterium]|nr:MAG: sensor histidine kinase [Calditrichota bacterium]